MTGATRLTTGALWVAVCWSVLTFAPVTTSALAQTAGGLLLLTAVMELVRALTSVLARWVYLGRAVAAAVLGVLATLSAGQLTPGVAGYVGLFLLVHGVAGMGAALAARAVDGMWGVGLMVGAAEAMLGVWISAPPRMGAAVVLVLGATALAEAVADVAAGLRLRQPGSAAAGAGAAAYAVGQADVAAATRRARPRHRAHGTALPGVTPWSAQVAQPAAAAGTAEPAARPAEAAEPAPPAEEAPPAPPAGPTGRIEAELDAPATAALTDHRQHSADPAAAPGPQGATGSSSTGDRDRHSITDPVLGTLLLTMSRRGTQEPDAMGRPMTDSSQAAASPEGPISDSPEGPTGTLPRSVDQPGAPDAAPAEAAPEGATLSADASRRTATDLADLGRRSLDGDALPADRPSDVTDEATGASAKPQRANSGGRHGRFSTIVRSAVDDKARPDHESASQVDRAADLLPASPLDGPGNEAGYAAEGLSARSSLMPTATRPVATEPARPGALSSTRARRSTDGPARGRRRAR